MNEGNFLWGVGVMVMAVIMVAVLMAAAHTL